MNREKLNKLTKEELIEEYLELQNDNAWWQRRWKAENRTAWEVFKPKIDKAIEYINYSKEISNPQDYVKFEQELLEILGDKENE